MVWIQSKGPDDTLRLRAYVHAQTDLNVLILCMFEGTFLLMRSSWKFMFYFYCLLFSFIY